MTTGLCGSATADQAWIEDACPRQLQGPAVWKDCVERNLRALQAGLPDIAALAATDRVWIEDACPRRLQGPAVWKDCVERNLQALQAGLPDITALTAADRAWIEDACPRRLQGPAVWKRCVERDLQALQAGLPDLTALAAADRAWIEDACPRRLQGPDVWKRCVERNLRALQAGLPELDTRDVGRTAAHSDGTGTIPPLEAKPELDQPDPAAVDPADRTRAAAEDGPLEAANDDPDPAPGLPAPTGGERWFCYTDKLSQAFDPEPELVLTPRRPDGQSIRRGPDSDCRRCTRRQIFDRRNRPPLGLERRFRQHLHRSRRQRRLLRLPPSQSRGDKPRTTNIAALVQERLTTA